MTKNVAFKLPNMQRISDSGQAGENKEPSSGSRARPQALDRRTAFPGGEGRRTGRYLEKGQYWRLLPQLLQRDCQG